MSNISEKAEIIKYGESHEGRDLIMLTVSSAENLNNLEKIKDGHLKHTDPGIKTKIDSSLPIIVNLGYGVHGNEPSSAEAAILSAYTLVASNNDKIKRLIENSVIFIKMLNYAWPILIDGLAFIINETADKILINSNPNKVDGY